MATNNNEKETLETWDRLQSESSRLFSPSIDQVEILCLPRGQKTFKKLSYDGNDGSHILGPEFKPIIDESSFVFYILKQEFSWSPLKVSFATIKEILDHHRVDSAFELTILAFGFKIKEDENIRYEHSFQFSKTSVCSQSTSHEISFNIRYPERNGRRPVDPWSLRQTGVYHGFDSEAAKNVCILLQPPTYLLDTIVRSLEGQKVESPTCCHILWLDLLSLLEWNWHPYLEYLWFSLLPFDEKASCWNASTLKGYGFKVELSDRQSVHHLYGRFQRAQSALDSRVELFQNHRSFACKISNSNHDLLPKLDALLARTCGYQKKIAAAIKRLDNVSEMISDILDHQRQEALAEISRGMQDNLVTLRSISYQAQQDQSLMGQLALQSQKESKATRALALIAAMYLPASFLAQLFSSNLVQIDDRSEAKPVGHFVLAPQFWIFCVVAIALTAMTWISKDLIEKRL